MQDIYAFDVGDFGKLGLLRRLAREARLRLGVLWWRTSLGSKGNDGRHVGYLNDRAYREADSELWDAMSTRFKTAKRQIRELHPLLPVGTTFHDVPVPVGAARSAWFAAAREEVRGKADLVFADPDNGIDFKRPPSQRHIGLDEVQALFDDGHSLVLYHTPGRQTSHGEQITAGLTNLRAVLPELGRGWGARFRRGTSRVFFVLAQERHAAAIEMAMAAMKKAWTPHFEIPPPQ